MRPWAWFLSLIRRYVGTAGDGVGRRAGLVLVRVARLVGTWTWVENSFIDRRFASSRNGKSGSQSCAQCRRQRIGVGSCTAKERNDSNHNRTPGEQRQIDSGRNVKSIQEVAIETCYHTSCLFERRQKVKLILCRAE